jgi:hypothetical protein
LLQGLGGLLVGSGLLNSNELAAIMSFVLLAIPALWAYLSKNKTAKIASGQLNAQSTGKVVKAPPKAGMVILLVFLSVVCHGQSIFKPLPIYRTPIAGRAHAVVGPTDSLPNISAGKFQGFRFAGPDLAFAVPDFSIYTGMGIDYVIAVADPTTGKWAYNFTIGPRVYGGANLGVPTVQTIGAVGLRITLFNGWLALGGVYNLTTKKPQATVGNPAALIPGLN